MISASYLPMFAFGMLCGNIALFLGDQIPGCAWLIFSAIMLLGAKNTNEPKPL